MCTPHLPPPRPCFAPQAKTVVSALPWVKDLSLKMDARPPQPLMPDDNRPNGLKKVAHVIAVSSCKGGAQGGKGALGMRVVQGGGG